MNTKIIKFDINKNLYNTLIAKQGDTKSRFLLFNLLDGSIPFSLENRSVRVYAVKPDRTEVFNDLIITDAAKGYCILELTTQMLAVAGTVKLELMVIEEDKKLTSNIFYMDVKESINSEKAVVSTNEFGALLTALQDVDNWNKEFTEKSGKLEELYTPRLNELGEQLDTKALKGKNIRIIAKENGDYTLPSLCVADGGDTNENPITMLVCPGIYEDQVYIKQWSRINLVGTNKKDCIIVNHGGSYSDEPLITAGERYIANITFRATHEKSTITDKNQWKSYAFHGDKSSGGDGTTLVENCRFESYHSASVGLGVYNNQTFHFKNCEFYSKIDWDSTQANIGAFFAHNNVSGGETNGRLIAENCIFFMDNDRSGYGHACYINDANLTDGDGLGNTLNVLFINCTLIRNVGGFVNALRIDNTSSSGKLSGSIELNVCSHGNNIAQLNAPQMIWQYPELPEGVTNFNGSFSQCRYGKDMNGNVVIEGLIKGCTDDMDLFTLPVGFRPKYNKYFTILSNDGSNLNAGSMVINSNGVVRLDKNIGNAFISLECSFVAEQ